MCEFTRNLAEQSYVFEWGRDGVMFMHAVPMCVMWLFAVIR